ncbi:hypothetical protein DOW33_13275 [Salmonella enterica subsp. arizonae]|nr:hypothetical protein [Salmonella enterica]EBJ4736775.1 hypothetical protein [Salmonella enterica]ECE6099914.1 hypothetical protein [Salmonella enterica subsp. arizonae]ECT9553089.1 hypothetical protein [Salmonella enterica subsp. arizonae serovar 41:z4,z23:-]
MTKWYKFNNKFHKITNYFNLCDQDRLNTFDGINLNSDFIMKYIFAGDYLSVYYFVFCSAD